MMVSHRPQFVNVNGKFLPTHAPAVSVLDRGLLYGDGLFETLRSYDGVPFLLEEHLARLNASAAELRIAEGLATSLIVRNISELLRLNELRDAYIRITLTRGSHAGRLELDPTDRPTVAIVTRPVRLLPPTRYDPGSSAIFAAIRQNAESPLPRHKTLNYLGNLVAKTEARDRGADEALLLNTRGEVAEAASSNVFLALGGRLVTPSLESNILPGVTRAEVLRLARQAGIPTEERIVRPDEFRAADEVFLTSSIAEIVPVRAIDGVPIRAGTPGPLTRRLHAAYQLLTRQPRETTASA